MKPRTYELAIATVWAAAYAGWSDLSAWWVIPIAAAGTLGPMAYRWLKRPERAGA